MLPSQWRVINHSCEPNLMSVKTNLVRNLLFDLTEANFLRNPCSKEAEIRYNKRSDLSIFDVVVFIALRDLEPGEEIFFDYNRDDTRKMPCFCQSPKCKRFFWSSCITGTKFWGCHSSDQGKQAHLLFLQGNNPPSAQGTWPTLWITNWKVV